MEGIRLVIFLFLFKHISYCATKDDDKRYRYIIACHTTDFACFKRQYTSLRDHVFFGNLKLGVNVYKPYTFEYGDTNTCIKIAGMENSELVAISMDSNNREFSYTLHAPLKIQQIKKNNITCSKPDISFPDVTPSERLKKFKANATIQVTYPYDLLKKRNDIFMILREEDIDLILDIPDLSSYNKKSKFEAILFANSEWAYEMVQHIDVAQHVALPYTGQLRTLTTRLPLNRFILLYPDERYTDMHFDFFDELSK